MPQHVHIEGEYVEQIAKAEVLQAQHLPMAVGKMIYEAEFGRTWQNFGGTGPFGRRRQTAQAASNKK